MDLGSPTLEGTSTLFLLFMFFDLNKTNMIHYGSDTLSFVPARSPLSVQLPLDTGGANS